MITIVDYSAGNPTSVRRALAAVGVESEISSDPERLIRAERVVFPGVGHAASTMAVLAERGLDQALTEVAQRGTPLLGVCVGGQMMLERSEEADTRCLALIPGTVKKFPELDRRLKVPHMGWNRVFVHPWANGKPHPVLAELPQQNEVYFVHSYYMAPSDPGTILGTTEHGLQFACAIARDNLVAVQFHPEKSGPLGLSVLKQFAEWSPSC